MVYDQNCLETSLSTKRPSIFIVGTQRAGTTLLRLILNAHSHIAIPEEAWFLAPLLKQKELSQSIEGQRLNTLVKYLSLNLQFKLWNYDNSEFISSLSSRKSITVKQLVNDLFTSYCRNMGKSIWGDKTPSFFRKIDILYTLFPEAKFIHIVRDGRDVFDSWRKIDQSKDNVAVTALDWRYKLFKIENSFNKIPESNRITIRYEDLLENPDKTVKTLCFFIGIKYESNMLNFYQTSHNYVGEHHSSLIFNPLNKDNRFKWKKNLSQREVRIFNTLARRYLWKYGYEVQDERFNASDLIYILKDLFIGLPKRAYQVLYANKVLEIAFIKGWPAKTLLVGKMPKKKADRN